MKPNLSVAYPGFRLGRGLGGRRYGHTLLELVIALALGVVVTGGASALYRTARASCDAATDWAAIGDAGQAALDLLGWQVRLAGLWLRADGAQPNVQTARAMRQVQLLPVFGCAAGRPAGPAAAPYCEADPGGNDGVQLMYLADPVASWADSQGAATDCLGQALPTGGLAVARFFTRVNSGSGEPELYCDGSGRLGNAQPLVEGVESLRVQYWLDGVDQAQRTVDADQWPHVRGLMLCLVVRGRPGSSSAPYLDCDGNLVRGSDGRRRQVFHWVLALRNHRESGDVVH